MTLKIVNCFSFLTLRKKRNDNFGTLWRSVRIGFRFDLTQHLGLPAWSLTSASFLLSCSRSKMPNKWSRKKIRRTEICRTGADLSQKHDWFDLLSDECHPVCFLTIIKFLSFKLNMISLLIGGVSFFSLGAKLQE